VWKNKHFTPKKDSTAAESSPEKGNIMRKNYHRKN
jgi:hypothetical protein